MDPLICSCPSLNWVWVCEISVVWQERIVLGLMGFWASLGHGYVRPSLHHCVTIVFILVFHIFLSIKNISTSKDTIFFSPLKNLKPSLTIFFSFEV